MFITKMALPRRTFLRGMGVTLAQAQAIVQGLFDGILETLVREGRIELRNFGVFKVKKRKPRKARNPRTGEKVKVPAKLVVTFKPGREMEQRVSAVGQRKLSALANKEGLTADEVLKRLISAYKASNRKR